MSATTNYLITGGNRGIGRGLVEYYLSRPNSTVVASVRDTDNASSKSLSTLPVASGSKLIVIKVDSLSEADAVDAAKALQSTYHIDHLDVVIANSGIAKFWGSALETPIKEVQEHFAVNTLGALITFQAFYSLLEASISPKFIVVSTAVASIAEQENILFPATAYGASKAAVNYITKKIHMENPRLISFPLHPGWVQTDMGNAGAEAMGLKEAPVTLEQCIAGMVEVIGSATRESTSGKFFAFDGASLAW